MALKPMLLTSASTIPEGKDWVYEVKYDGFRCLLQWEDEIPRLFSRNGNVLNEQFPELIQFCQQAYATVKPFLPLTLDGELVKLENNYKSDFNTVQYRGRLRTEKTIQQCMQSLPCHYIAFDLLEINGDLIMTWPLANRKGRLIELFRSLGWPQSVHFEDEARIQALKTVEHEQKLWDELVLHNGEGLVAKTRTSQYLANKRTKEWVKIKNWRYATVVLTAYDQGNGYFTGAVYREGKLANVVTFRHGLTNEEEQTLVTFFKANGTKKDKDKWVIVPSICVSVICIGMAGDQLREPQFYQFQFETEPSECTWHQLQRQMNPLPTSVTITSPDKPIWNHVNKDDYLLYLQLIAPYMLPFLRERLLTVIRYPHGAIQGERFYQKNCPDYAPAFVITEQVDDIRYIVCNGIETLLWLGNQLALEFHIPFQTRETIYPTEIVFDLDPPSIKEFSLAREAALRMKAIFDQFELRSFVKTSGGKGLQVYIPLPDNDTFTYDDTRLFTEFVCRFLCEQEPHWFTLERLKKNRHNRLYLDYIQHDYGKTIIAPYSPRGHAKGLVATPLYWNEITDFLMPEQFTLFSVLDRLKTSGDPFQELRSVKSQPFQNVLTELKNLV